MLKKKKSFIKS